MNVQGLSRIDQSRLDTSREFLESNLKILEEEEYNTVKYNRAYDTIMVALGKIPFFLISHEEKTRYENRIYSTVPEEVNLDDL